MEKRYVFISTAVYSNLTITCKTVVKKRKLNSDLAEVICVLGEMEKAAEERAEGTLKEGNLSGEWRRDKGNQRGNMKRECS